MPRLAGQIDEAKTEAILDAATELMAKRGVSASMEELARRAGVSKQTLYNRYGCKAEIVRALVERRVNLIVAPLGAPEALEHPQEALAAFARSMLQHLANPTTSAMMRAYIAGAAETPGLGRAVFEAGPETSRRRLAEFLKAESEAGRMEVADPVQAAEFFAGMVLGGHQTAGLLGVDRGLTPERIAAIADEAAARFMKAYGI